MVSGGAADRVCEDPCLPNSWDNTSTVYANKIFMFTLSLETVGAPRIDRQQHLVTERLIKKNGSRFSASVFFLLGAFSITIAEVKDLLPDNLVLQKQLESLQPSKQASKAKLREVRSVSTCLYCFSAYMETATSDTRTREQLTYTRLILRETLRTGGDGWAAYDRLFREHATLDKSKKMDGPAWTQASIRPRLCGKPVLKAKYASTAGRQTIATVSAPWQGPPTVGTLPSYEERVCALTQILAAPKDIGEHLHLLEPGELPVFPWDGHFHVFTVLPFGISTVCYMFTKLLRHLVCYWRARGFRIWCT